MVYRVTHLSGGRILYDPMRFVPHYGLSRRTVEYIKETVGASFDVTPQQMVGYSRKQRIVRARQLAMYLASTVARKKSPEIGRLFGGRDHTTVLHAIRQVENLMTVDGEFLANVETIRGRLV